FVLWIIDKSYRLDHRSEIALHGIGRAIDKAPPRHDPQTLKRDAKLEKIGEDAESLPLQLSAERIAKVRAVDNPSGRERLGHNRLVADDAKLNVVPLRIKSPVIERQHAEHPDAAADALHADLFTFEIRRSLDVRRNHECAIEFVNQACDENQIEPAGHG